MRKLLTKIAVFLLLFCVSVVASYLFDAAVVGNQFTESYQASLIDKVERLQSIHDPKIILIGNSNVCFGIRSEMIQDAFGMPVVNMGLHGDLGNAFHEEMVKLSLHEGDIVIVCHSDFSDNDSILDPELAWTTLEHHSEMWPLIRRQDWPKMAEGYPKYLYSAVSRWAVKYKQPEGAYFRSGFNEYGDYTENNGKKLSYVFAQDSVLVPEINDTCIDRLNALNEYVSANHAALLIAGYPIGYGEYTPDKSLYDSFERELREKLNCAVISRYTDYFFPYQYFYNTKLHLNGEGAMLRTQQLIADLKGWMGENQKEILRMS